MEEAIPNTVYLQVRTLVIQSQEGDSFAFESLMKKYRSRLSALVYRYMGSTIEVDDLLQVLWYKIYSSIRSFNADQPFYPWLRRVMVNLCCDEMRRSKRQARIFYGLKPDEIENQALTPFYSADASSVVIRKEAGELIQNALAMLPRDHQKIIALYYLKQMSFSEISVIMKCTSSAARIKAFRARAALRALLQRSAKSGYLLASDYFQGYDICS